MSGNEVVRVGRCDDVVVDASDLGGKDEPSSRNSMEPWPQLGLPLALKACLKRVKIIVLCFSMLGAW